MTPPATPFRPPARSAVPMSIPILAVAAAAGVGAFAYFSAARKPNFDGFGLHSLKVHSTALVSHDTKRIRFELPDATQPSGVKLTSAVLTLAFPGGGWKPCARPYTPVNDPDQPGYLDLLVKKYPTGRQSPHLHSLQPGDRLTVAGPLPGFAYKANQHAHVALLAGGAGITPMYSLVKGILSDAADRTRVTLVWGVNGEEDAFLKEELEGMRKKSPDRLRVVYAIKGLQENRQRDGWVSGYVDRKVLEGVGLRGEQDTKVLVCGPPGFEKALQGGEGVLGKLGYKRGQIYKF